jgi:D-3-phosphoglycerate dehydrogenase
MTNTMQQTVVIADYDYGDVDIERAIIEDAGLRLVAAQCKTEDDVIEAARDADAIIAQYATVRARAIAAFTRCRVVARYGTGVDIVDVDAATRRGILVTNGAQRLVPERGRRSCHGPASRRGQEDLRLRPRDPRRGLAVAVG